MAEALLAHLEAGWAARSVDAAARDREAWVYMANMLDLAGDAMVLFDAAGTVRCVNEAAVGLFGRDREQLMAESMVFTAPEGESVELQVLRSDGARVGALRVVPVAWLGEPMQLATIRDVTQQRALELQMLASERTASVGMLAAAVLHEIHNPLATVIGNLELALVEGAQLEGPAAAAARAAQQDALAAATRIRGAVADLAVFARRRPGPPQPCEVRRVIDSVVRIATNELGERVRVVVEAGPMRAALANEACLSQALLNMLVAAAHALPDDVAQGREVVVSAAMDDDGRVAIDVILPPEAAIGVESTAVFTSNREAPVALGLALAEQLMVEMGGELLVRLADGEPTRLAIRLPAADPASNASIAPGPAAASGAAPAASAVVRRPRVLVVDDDVGVGSALRRSLQRDYDVTYESSSLEALARLECGERFDAILCDVMMPALSGPELVHALVRIDPRQAERVTFITGGAFTRETMEMVERTACPQLNKPFDVNELRDAVAAMLRQFARS